MMKPVFVVGGLYSESSGVTMIMRDLAAALGRAGAPVTVAAAECRDRESIGEIFESPSQWISAKGLWLGGLSWSPALKRLLKDAIATADVVHNHSLWMLPNSYGSRMARDAHKPVVITAHGTLEPWALNHSRWKKRIVGLAFQDRDLRQADCIQVNSASESESVRRYGLRCPIAVIPNGVNIEDDISADAMDQFRSAFPTLRNKRLVLFMARLHKKKGLDHLLTGWRRVSAEFRDWHLVIAGPDRGYEKPARTLTRELEIGDSVTFTGNLHGMMKRAALAAADVFALPSFSEGFSMGVLEALAAAVPVLLTPGCHFPEAAACGAAREVEPNADDTTRGLRELMRLTDGERASMGAKGRELVERHYTWDRVAEQTLSMYGWLTQGGTPPDFVRMN